MRLQFEPVCRGIRGKTTENAVGKREIARGEDPDCGGERTVVPHPSAMKLRKDGAPISVVEKVWVNRPPISG
jgi:hypothetical protein